MVATSDLKCYKTTNFLGGAITGTEVVSGTFNNIFSNVPKNELVIGEDYYAAVYFKNTHAVEAMDNFKLWLASKTQPPDTILKWGFESATGISFDGVDDGINCGDEVTLWSQAKTKFSFSIDVYANNWASGPVGDNIIKHDITSNGRFALESITSGNNIDFNIRNTGGSYIHAGTATVSTGAWHNVVCTYDNSLGSENMKLYVDAVKVGTASLTDTVTATGDLTIAGNADIESAFDGFVRDFRYWVNKTLTQTEVNNVNADLPSAPAPDHWLLMNEGNGDPVDSISGTKTGVLINGASWATPTAQIISDKYSSPVNITWQSLSSPPVNPNVGKLSPNEAFPVWLWLHVNANAEARLDDAGIFNFRCNIPVGGTGTGGTGGNPDPNPNNLILDTFGLNKFHATKPGGKEWFSTAWNNGVSRTLLENDYDSFDSDFGLSNAPQVTINGDGSLTCETLQPSYRIYVNGPWTNTEITTLARVNTGCSSFQLRSRSNHHGVDNDPYGLSGGISCGFGNYEVAWTRNENLVETEIEVIHDIYVRDIDQHASVASPLNEWQGYKQITRTIDNNKVLVQGWRNRNIADQTDWVKETEFTFDGTNIIPDPTGFEANVTACLSAGDSISGDLVGNCVWKNASKWSWIRMNDTQDLDLKFFSVREITPITTGGSGGTGGNPPPAPSDFKIAFVGDEGCETATDNVISMMKNQNYDFIMSVGDHAYSGASCWTTKFNSLKSIMNSAYGNHEYSESGGVGPYKTFFGHSLTYFTFQFQNIFFLVFDTNINSDPGSAQHNFMTSELNRIANDNTVTWKVGVCHHPVYGSGSDHPYNEFNQRQNYHTLFQSHGVSFWCTGHNHNFQRTHQITYNAANNGSPNIVDSTSPYSRTTVGLIHVVTGTGGHDTGSGLYSLGSQPSYQAYQNRTHNGIWEMVASNSAQTLTCSFVDINGDRFDTFQITA